MFRIVDWGKHFENNRTRELKKLEWVPFPNKHDGDGYTELLDHPDGEAHYGAWCAIVQVASKCEPRGTLMRDGARAHDARSLARMTRFKEGIVEAALERLVVEIGWLEVISDPDDTEEVRENPQEDARLSHPPAEKRLGNGSEGNGREPYAPNAFKGVGALGSASGQAGQSSRSLRTRPTPINAGEGGEGPFDLSDLDWNRVIVMAESVARKIPPRKTDDRRFWLKFAVLAEIKFSEAWLADAVEAVMQAKVSRKGRQVHFMGVVKSKAIELGVDPGGWKPLLKRVEIPPAVWGNTSVLEIKR